MGIWTFVGGQVWNTDEFVANDSIECEVAGEHDRKVLLDDEDLITNGIIDSHCHIWGPKAATEVHIAEEFLPTQGALAIVDGGTFGYDGWAAADRFWKYAGVSQIRSFLNVRPEGWTSFPVTNPTKACDIVTDKLIETYKYGGARALGLKLALGLSDTHEEEEAILRLTRDTADRIGARIAVHISKSKVSLGELSGYMRSGDILLHPFNGNKGPGYPLDDKGKFSGEIMALQKRGVLVDCAVGRAHFSFEVAKAAFREGFQPDIISTDENLMAWQKGPFRDLIHLVSCLTSAMKMPLDDAFRAVTSTPQKNFGFDLDKNNSFAVFKKKPDNVKYRDFREDTMEGGFEYLTEIVILKKNALVVNEC